MTTLTHDLLESFLDQLERAGWPTRQRLAPGLTDEQMDELTAPLGLQLPNELRVWWSMQNGGRNALFQADSAFASLEEMVALAIDLRALDESLNEDGVTVWDTRLLPVAHRGDNRLGCDCSVANSNDSPVWIWRTKDAEDLEGPILPSLGSLVEIWSAAIDEGLYEYLPDGTAVSHTDRLAEGRWPRGLP